MEVWVTGYKPFFCRDKVMNHFFQELACNAKAKPVLVALNLVINRTEMLPSVYSLAIAGPVRIFENVGYRSEETMGRGRKLLSMSCKGRKSGT